MCTVAACLLPFAKVSANLLLLPAARTVKVPWVARSRMSIPYIDVRHVAVVAGCIAVLPDCISDLCNVDGSIELDRDMSSANDASAAGLSSDIGQATMWV